MDGTSVNGRVRGREKFSKYKKIINAISWCYGLFPKKARLALFAFHRRTRGKLGLVIRYALLKKIAVECGDNVAIFEDVYLYDPQYLRIGSNVSIHPMCYIDCGKDPNKGLIVGSDTGIAHGVTIMSNMHTIQDRDVPNKLQPFLTEQIRIGSDCGIGAKTTILAGVTVGDGAIVGANSVVTKDVEPYAIMAGAPARKIGERTSSKKDE